MKNTLKLQWKRLLTDALVIILSILLAFGIDAWWDNRSDRKDERVVLQSLLNDLNEKQAFRDHNQQRRRAILGSAKTLLRITTEQPADIDERLVSQLLGELMWYDCAACYSSGPLNLVVTGTAAVNLSNATLTQELLKLHSLMAQIRDGRQRAIDFYFDKLAPYLAKNADLAHLGSSIKHEPGHPEVLYDFPIKDIINKVNYVELLTDLEFHGLLYMRIDQLGDLFRNGFMPVDESLQEAISLLEQELHEF